MTFAEAAETCFLRRMELIAFDKDYEIEHGFFKGEIKTKIFQAGQLFAHLYFELIV